MSADPRIAIVGIGGLFPRAADLRQFWANVATGVDASREVPPGRWPVDPQSVLAPGIAIPDKVHTSRGYYLDHIPLDLSFEGLDPVFHLILHAGRQAFADAVTANLDRQRAGVILGHIALPTEKASALALEYLGRTFAERAGWPDVPPQTDARNRYVAGLPAGILAQTLGLGGGSCTLDAACASSLYAVKLAADELRAGRSDLMLTGGAARPDCLYTQMGFAQLRALSPSGRCSPFDAAGDGLMVGEGCGVLALKRLDDALRDGDHIYAVLAGVGLSNDVAGSLLAPASEGQLRAMRDAYRQAGWRPTDVDLIECHATGTPVGDAVEFASLMDLWKDEAGASGRCVIGSVKSSVGHLLTGAGSAGLIKALLALQNDTLPPTANFQTAARDIRLSQSPFRVLSRGEEWRRRAADVPRRAAVSGFGFGGINAHLLLEEFLPHIHSRTASVTVPSLPAGEPIAVVGMDARFGPWRSLRAFQQRVLGGDDSIEPAPKRHWWGAETSDWFRQAHGGTARFAGFFIDEIEFPLSDFRTPPNELKEMLPQQLLALQSAAAALRDAGNWKAHRDRAGVFLGMCLDLNTTNFHFRWMVANAARTWLEKQPGSFDRGEVERWLDELRDTAHPPLTANRTMGALASIAASRIARAFEFAGPSFTICSEESSGGRALELAVRALQRGEIDLALTGAVDLAGDLRAVLAADAANGGVERPVGEGAVTLVLKRLADAERDGDRVYTIIRGIGVASDAAAATRRAQADADVSPATVGLLEISGPRDAATWADCYSNGTPPLLSCAADDIGYSGAVSFIASVVKACLALHQNILPPSRAEAAGQLRGAQFWLANRDRQPRRAGVHSTSIDGNHVHAIVEEYVLANTPAEEESRRLPLGAPIETVFAIDGDSPADLLETLVKLGRLTEDGIEPIARLAQRWWAARPPHRRTMGLAMVSRNRDELGEQIAFARRHLSRRPGEPFPDADATTRDRIFYSPRSLAAEGELAFVFPGSGNHFAGMGRELAARWPQVLRRQQQENERLFDQFHPELLWNDGATEFDPRAAIFGQVTLAGLVSDLLGLFGVRPAAAIGYSLGESAALFALRAWTARDEMFRRMEASTLFASDLASYYDAARKAWGTTHDEPIDWLSGVLSSPADKVRSAIQVSGRVYLLIINTLDECVIGGERAGVEALVRRLGARFLPLAGVTIAHCEVLTPVATAYHELHVLPTTPPPGVRFYSGALGRAYKLTADSAADAILGHASAAIDFPRLIETAYADGARLFVEIGPGGSCSRMIGRILNDRPHLARSACVSHANPVSTLLRLLAHLYAEGAPVDFAPLFDQSTAELSSGEKRLKIPAGGEPFRIPPPPRPQTEATPVAGTAQVSRLSIRSPVVDGLVTGRAATADAHGAYLRFAESGTRQLSNLLAFQQSLLPLASADSSVIIEACAVESRPALDMAQCREFAVGSIAKVLGPEFAPVDRHPTRVRLPDGPLMLVDRIWTIEGEPRSLTSGRVVTDHLVHKDRWYMQERRIPTAVAVEAGQADLFLSGYLGIDFVTKGLAVYRLLDAVVTFHRGLPGPGELIRYDIVIDHFFRQGETYLFRFRFEGTVNGEPLLTMTNGCAGFFTAAELASGKGIVHTALDRRPLPGRRPADWREFVPLNALERYDERQLASLQAGDLAGCFGPAFAGLPLATPLTLPDGMLKLVDRVTELEPGGGRYGLGRIRAEMDIHPDDWFLTCHFVDDQVMPGTLMYECCLHTLRVFLLRLGWVGENGRVACEPVPGVASQLKCRGQVIASTRVVTYEVSLKEIGYRPEPFAICDALMYADGKPIVEIMNMSLRLSGTNREEIEQLWRDRARSSPAKKPLFDRDRITAFAIGYPSDAFGERYRVFDSERVIARLPGPPFQFLDRITAIADCEPWKHAAGGRIEAEYDVPAEAWYFAANRQPTMPFAVLLEAALQPCGWLAAYLGSALTSPEDLSFRNLGGKAAQLAAVGPDAGTLTTQVKITRVSSSGGMIIQNYDYRVSCRGRTVYEGDTYFGFFSRSALAQQVGVRDPKLYEPSDGERGSGLTFPVPREAPFPDDMLRMVDDVELFVPDGGPHGLGFIRGTKAVNPADWFFKAHFHQDPVWPGSLGLEAFLQLLKVIAARRWGTRPNKAGQTVEIGRPHTWVYRGQVVPTARVVTVEAVVTAVDNSQRLLRADGFLTVDGRTIYQMTDFTLRG